MLQCQVGTERTGLGGREVAQRLEILQVQSQETRPRTMNKPRNPNSSRGHASRAHRENRSSKLHYLELPHHSAKRRVLLALLFQSSHILVELADVCGVHLQVGPFLEEDVCQLGILIPVHKTPSNKIKHFCENVSTMMGRGIIIHSFIHSFIQADS